jgi:hypothetical protein
MTLDLYKLEALMREATAGPWMTSAHGALVTTDDGIEHYGARELTTEDPNLLAHIVVVGDRCVHDAAMVCAAVNALPELIRAARERERLERLCRRMRTWGAEKWQYSPEFCAELAEIDRELAKIGIE